MRVMWIELWISGVENVGVSTSEGTVLARKVCRHCRSAHSLEPRREGRAVGVGSITLLVSSGRAPADNVVRV